MVKCIKVAGGKWGGVGCGIINFCHLSGGMVKYLARLGGRKHFDDSNKKVPVPQPDNK